MVLAPFYKITSASPSTTSAFPTVRENQKDGRHLYREGNAFLEFPLIFHLVSWQELSHDQLKLQWEVGVLVGPFVDQNIWVKLIRRKGRTDIG